jgi:hypothetical protein
MVVTTEAADTSARNVRADARSIRSVELELEERDLIGG